MIRKSMKTKGRWDARSGAEKGNVACDGTPPPGFCEKRLQVADNKGKAGKKEGRESSRARKGLIVKELGFGDWWPTGPDGRNPQRLLFDAQASVLCTWKMSWL
jgi:hypothetical protein